MGFMTENAQPFFCRLPFGQTTLILTSASYFTASIGSNLKAGDTRTKIYGLASTQRMRTSISTGNAMLMSSNNSEVAVQWLPLPPHGLG